MVNTLVMTYVSDDSYTLNKTNMDAWILSG